MKNRVYTTMAALICIIALISGCEKKDEDRSHVGGTPRTEEVQAYVKAISKGMSPVSTAKVTDRFIGKKCTIVAMTAQGHVAPPPPPPGMMRIMGPTTIYSATLTEVTDDSLTVEAPYPSGERVKQIKIRMDDIDSIAIQQ